MLVAVHYAEIGLKGRNRPRFERFLRAGLERALAPLGSVSVHRLRGRLLVELPDAAGFDAVARRLQTVFGVAYFSRADAAEPSLASIEKAVDAFVAEREFASFGIRARRADKSLPFTSSDLAVRLGRRVEERTGAKVDLDQPELWIEIHALSDTALLLHERVRGPGGLPVGSAGRAVSLISGGIDSPVASYQMLKRGCSLRYVHFHSAPFTSPASQAKVRDLVARLAVHQGPSTLFLAPFAELQQTLVREAAAPPRIVLYRRFMLRVAEALARRSGARALVTGESLGQVSSQTLGNLDTIGRAASLPVLRPLIGTDKQEIVARARTLGTYEISIEPDEDCCSYLMPRHPTTWSDPDEVDAIERRLDVEALVDATLAGVARERVEPA